MDSVDFQELEGACCQIEDEGMHIFLNLIYSIQSNVYI